MSVKQAIINCVNGSNSINNHKCIPQSMYVGTTEFYKEKLGDRLPDVQYELMELQSRPDLHKNDDYLNQLKEMHINEYNNLMNEFKEREEEGKDYEQPELTGTVFYAVENDGNIEVLNKMSNVINIFKMAKLYDV